MSAPAQRPRVIVLADHPSLHRGFATIGREVAAFLHAAGFELAYAGYYRPDPAWRSPGYELVGVELDDDDPARRAARVQVALEPLLAGRGPAVLLSIGTMGDQRAVLAALDELRGVPRPTTIAYAPTDFAPLPVQLMEVAERFDAVVPYSRFARAALLDCAARAGVGAGAIRDPIPHGVDVETFRPLSDERRRETRQRLFGLGDDAVLLGFFGRNSGHKRADLVLHLAQALIHGRFTTCEGCARVQAHGLDREGYPRLPAGRCHSCGGSRLSPGQPCDQLHLYMHTDLHGEAARRITGGRDLAHIADRYQLGERVRFNEALEVGRGEPSDHLAQRMAACDVHVLPYDCAGWELTVLETGACGVPNVITDFATPPEYAAPFSRLVPPGGLMLEADARGLIDVDLALQALRGLIDDPVSRRRLGSHGPEVAARHAWPRVGAWWASLIAELGDTQHGGAS